MQDMQKHLTQKILRPLSEPPYSVLGMFYKNFLLESSIEPPKTFDLQMLQHQKQSPSASAKKHQTISATVATSHQTSDVASISIKVSQQSKNHQTPLIPLFNFRPNQDHQANDSKYKSQRARSIQNSLLIHSKNL